MRRSRRSTLRKNLRRLKAAAPEAQAEAEVSLADSRAVTVRLEAAIGAAGSAEAPAAPERVLLRRLTFTAERLSQARRPSEVAAETLALAALFSGIGRGMVVGRVRASHYAVAARRDLSACTQAERRTLEATARAVLARRAPLFDPGGLLLALPLVHDDEVLGAIVLQGPGRDRPLDASDRATLLGLARQAARALARATAHATAPGTAVSGSSRTRSC